jgi:hypothetical protein
MGAYIAAVQVRTFPCIRSLQSVTEEYLPLEPLWRPIQLFGQTTTVNHPQGCLLPALLELVAPVVVVVSSVQLPSSGRRLDAQTL